MWAACRIFLPGDLAAITMLKGNTAYARNPQLICTRPNRITQYFPRAAEALEDWGREPQLDRGLACASHLRLPLPPGPALANQR